MIPTYVAADVMWRKRLKTARGRATPGFPRHIISDALQQFQDGVLRFEAGTSFALDARLHKTAPHHLDVRGGVAVSCGDLGVAKPGLDRQEIDARPEEFHGERMSEDVR